MLCVEPKEALRNAASWRKKLKKGPHASNSFIRNAATTGLKATGRSVGDFNDGFREIADEMNEYSVRSLENVFRAWQQFLDARPLRQAVELQTRYAQNAYEAYVGEMTKTRGAVSQFNPTGL